MDDELKVLREELKVQREQTFATQFLVLGLMATMLKAGNRAGVETAFEFADSMAIALSMQNRNANASVVSVDVLAALEKLRAGVLPR